MTKQIGFGSHGEFTPGEVAFIIEQIAAMQPLTEIQKQFFKFTNEKKILPGSVIQQIQLKYSDKIKAQCDAYIKNIEGNPLAHQRSEIGYVL